MKATEAAALLTIAAAYDNRKPDADQARAWALVLDGLRFEDCRDAIVAHYRSSREWLMPVNIVEGVTALRWKRLGAFNSLCSLNPPPHLADNPRGEIEWRRRIDQRVMDGEITHPSQVDEHGDLKPHDVAELGLVGQRVPARD